MYNWTQLPPWISNVRSRSGPSEVAMSKIELDIEARCLTVAHKLTLISSRQPPTTATNIFLRRKYPQDGESTILPFLWKCRIWCYHVRLIPSLPSTLPCPRIIPLSQIFHQMLSISSWSSSIQLNHNPARRIPASSSRYHCSKGMWWDGVWTSGAIAKCRDY